MTFGFALTRPGRVTTAPRTAQYATDDRKPALILDYDIDDPIDEFLGGSPDLGKYRYVWLLVRHSGRPIEIVQTDASTADLGERLSGLAHIATTREVRATAGIDAAVPPPSVTVVICTRDRPHDVVHALESLERQTHEDFDILVVDNAPTNDATARAVEGLRGRLHRLDYVVEPRPGLAQARNCAINAVHTDVVAWIDDDETAESTWLAEIVDAFVREPEAAAVSGSVVPAELETWPQWWFEQYGGHSKGRGFTEVVFPRGETNGQSPLYPLPPFGVGANMAFRTSALVELGGFDRGLGAGTPTFGGEDTLIFSQLLVSGHTVVYQPAAMTRHFHRRTFPELESQMFGYGVGLTAYYAALLRWRWRLIVPLVALAPRAVRDLLGRGDSAITKDLPDDFPRELLRLKKRGMAAGPVAYVRSRRGASPSPTGMEGTTH